MRLKQTGYCDCSCPDCFELAIGEAGEIDPLCADCQSSGCDCEGECQSPNAYGMDHEPSVRATSDRLLALMLAEHAATCATSEYSDADTSETA